MKYFSVMWGFETLPPDPGFNGKVRPGLVWGLSPNFPQMFGKLK